MSSSLHHQGPNQALKKGGRQTDDQNPRKTAGRKTKIKTEPSHHPNHDTVRPSKENPGGQPIIHLETPGFSKIPDEPKNKGHPKASINGRFDFSKTPASQDQTLRPKPFNEINNQRINQPVKKIKPVVIQTLSPPRLPPRSFMRRGGLF